MQLNKFMKDAGFKILALSGLSSPQYSIVLYLINCAASGMDEIPTTYSELSSLVGHEEEVLREALLALVDKNMIHLKTGGSHGDAFKIQFEFDVHRWIMRPKGTLSPNDALVFPFKPQKGAGNKPGEKKTKGSSEVEPWEVVLKEYKKQQGAKKTVDMLGETKAAHILVKTHPVSQVLIMLRHFEKRVKSLSLLASSWQHYQELYESENHKVDLEDARKKHHALDEQLRSHARKHLSKADHQELSEEEVAVLKVIVHHQHPRRQLYWAYQFHDRYPKLQNFFVENASLMLSVTTHGTIVKSSKPDKRDK